MADSSYGLRDIYIDLTSVGARTIRDIAGDGKIVFIDAITINGTSGAGAGDIVLRSDAASSGPIVHKTLAPGGTGFDGTKGPSLLIRARGLYMDALANAWAAGSFMIIHTR